MDNISQVMNEILKRMPQVGDREATIRSIIEYPEVKDFIEAHGDQLSSEMIANSISKLNEFVLEKEALKAGRSGQNPGFTPELFINFNYIDVSYRPTSDYLANEKQRKRDALIDNRMMSRDVKAAQLADYDMSTPERQALMGDVMQFIATYIDNPKRAQGIYISGPFGVGKTYLLGALANSLASKGIAVQMLHYPTFATELKSLIGRDNLIYQNLEKVKQAPVLIIDDIGAESNSAWLRDDITNVILEHRMKESLSTFFTSNFSMAELEKHLASSRDADEPVKAKRLMERIKYLAQERVLFGENRRSFGSN